ncbi:MAG: adenine phosphoribosyltransferase, partial [Oxalobacteraceae bacterium]
MVPTGLDATATMTDCTRCAGT